ncbi:ComF family protein [Patescibacteria group bacterium]|nr:ComF family protein [Patescibacteria group bacterium]
MNIKNIILDILFPKLCLGCGQEGKYICSKCELFVSEASSICPVCGGPSFNGDTHLYCKTKYSLDGLTSVWDYDGLAKQLIYKIKIGGITHIISEVIEDFFKIIAKDSDRFHSFLSFSISDKNCIAYVPSFKKKEKKRGFNQAEIIAKELGKISNSKVVSLLKKIIDTKDQTELSKEERFENVKAAFAPLSGATASQGNVLLVDDIFTTGATMRECCKVLKQSGVKKVWGFTLARTP